MMLKMVEGLNYGVMAVITMENIRMDRSMEEESITGQMDLNIAEVGNKMKCMVKENLSGLMAENTRDNSPWDRWKEMEYTNGKTVENTKDNITKIRSMAMACMFTQMVVSLKVNGETACKMVLDT